MGSDGVVVDPPSFNDAPRLRKRDEDVLVQAFVAQPAVEALDEDVLHRLARRDVVPLDPGILGEAQDGPADQLCAVVRDDHAGLPATGDDLAQFAHNPHARQRGVDDQGQAFPREVIDDREHTEAPTVVERVGEEVEAPALVWPLRDRHRCPRAERALAAATFAKAAVS